MHDLEQEKQVLQRLLEFGSDTEENRRALANIRFGAFKIGTLRGHHLALGLKNRNLTVSDAVYALEEIKTIPRFSSKRSSHYG